MEQLLRKDEKYWTKHIQVTKKKARDVISQLERATDEHNRKLAAILGISSNAIRVEEQPELPNAVLLPAAQVQSKYSLRKLSVWGNKVAANELDFEWPYKELFAQMSHDIRLQ